jgi:hypothetical protein
MRSGYTSELEHEKTNVLQEDFLRKFHLSRGEEPPLGLRHRYDYPMMERRNQARDVIARINGIRPQAVDEDEIDLYVREGWNEGDEPRAEPAEDLREWARQQGSRDARETIARRYSMDPRDVTQQEINDYIRHRGYDWEPTDE